MPSSRPPRTARSRASARPWRSALVVCAFLAVAAVGVGAALQLPSAGAGTRVTDGFVAQPPAPTRTPPSVSPSPVVTPSSSPPPVLTLSILDEIDADVKVGTSGSSLLAVQAAAKLIEWGVNTGLSAKEIDDAATTWLSSKTDNLTEFLQKLELVDDAYQKLLTDQARELLDSAGCESTEITWGSQPVEAVEAIMQAAGRR